jgi:preprotein translocase subunit SecY
MDGVFYTLHDFMTHTKNISYILMAVSLIGFAGFWCFLVGRDEDD